MGIFIHFKGWFVMGFVSTVLFIAVAVPAAYIDRKSSQTIYVCVLTPVVWALYIFLMHIVIYRPLSKCTDAYSRGMCCNTDNGRRTFNVWLFTKELYMLNEHLYILTRETTELQHETLSVTHVAEMNEEDEVQEKSSEER